MTAGHIVILSFISLIFIFESFLISPVAVGFALFINLLEVFIAFLQAYIFTLLTSLFMGMSIHPQH
jgi:F-type H+-transporting ATPase subunit a